MLYNIYMILKGLKFFEKILKYVLTFISYGSILSISNEERGATKWQNTIYI